MAWRCAYLSPLVPDSWSTCTHRLRDMAEGMDVDILNEDGTDLTAPAKVIFGAVSLVTAFIGVSLALIVGDGLGALLGQWLGGGSGGAPPGF